MPYMRRGGRSKSTPEDPDFDFVDVKDRNGTVEIHVVPPVPWQGDHKMSPACPCDPRYGVEHQTGRVTWLHRTL